MSFASKSVSTGQDASAIGHDPLPETIPLPLTPPGSPSPGSAISQAVTTQAIPMMEVSGDFHTVLEEELVSPPNDEYNLVLTESAGYPTCGKCNTYTP